MHSVCLVVKNVEVTDYIWEGIIIIGEWTIESIGWSFLVDV